MHHPEISIIIPCLNEEQSIGICINNIKEVIKNNKLNAELIVVDNNSTDKSQEIIKSEIGKFREAKLVIEKQRGYGSAYLRGFKEAKAEYIFIADSDNTYDFRNIPRFINELERGYDLIIGDRFKGKMEKEAMPFSNKYIGNPILSGMLRLFFNTEIHDSHSGMRAIRKEALNKLNLRTTGMEFASEMIIKAIKRNLKIKEIPINYYKRQGNSKLNPFSDAWKHIRFMLLYCPLFLFLIPGVLMLSAGIISMMLFYFENPEIFGIKFYTHPIFLSSLLTLAGYQLVIFSAFAKSYAINHLGEESRFMNKIYGNITIEKASIFGILLSLMGSIIFLFILGNWINSGFGSLNETKSSVLALTLIILGIQTIFSSFMLSILGIKK